MTCMTTFTAWIALSDDLYVQEMFPLDKALDYLNEPFDGLIDVIPYYGPFMRDPSMYGAKEGPFGFGQLDAELVAEGMRNEDDLPF